MRPDDITDEELQAAYREPRNNIEAALAAQNELRDRRVRAHVIEEIAQALPSDELFLDALIDIVCGWTGNTGTDEMAVQVQVREAVVRRVRAMNDTGDTDAH